ncbi:hypothetical protein GCM10009720_21100 [Yaniella flava]|uniref:DUF4064 domain-containing protein n=1 Tax=Yaniella flava TaxID=287930 RepID=A0ABP5G5A0_9MICC|nr:hypothetical protein [Micrococcaceae bacterium]
MSLNTDFQNMMLENAQILGVTDFKGGWDRVWSTLTSSAPGLEMAMNIIGVILIVAAILSYLWQHRKGSGWGNGTAIIIGAAILGTALLAPAILFPLLLGVIDWLIAFVVNLGEDPLSQ